MTRGVILSGLAISLCTGMAMARAVPAEGMCDAAARQAGLAYDVPLDILLSIARVESGRGQDHIPWPWTINSEGQGHWFDSAQEAITFAKDRLAAGSANFDVGCFQINLHWHPNAFSTLEEAFDPDANAGYAARFLRDLYRSDGDWQSAVASYHSKTLEHRQAYIRQVETAYSDLSTSQPDAVRAKAEPVDLPNRFPLLQAGQTGGFGSLVPQRPDVVALIGGAP